MTAVKRMVVALLLVSWALEGCTTPASADSLTGSPQEASMQEAVYTLGVWRVKPGQEEEFVAAWKALGQIFSELPNPPGTGTLIQSVSDPRLFYSFGPWKRVEDIEAMRSNPRAQKGIQRLISFCSEATPGTFRVVAEVPAGIPQVR
jgi:hypothetical protein